MITGADVNELFPEVLWKMRASSFVEESRNGLVKTITYPIMIKTLLPKRRVLFCADRKENPYFHFFECLWMMAGRKDSEWLEQWNPRMKEYAEEDGLIHGAYGHRWRFQFSFDQILAAVQVLRNDPTSRRAVISMWDAFTDLDSDKKDLPCNTHIYLRVVDGALNMTICNRSNDLVWGALGSNIVHFSFLQELIAWELKIPVGFMYQFTNNLHIYERHWHFLDIPPVTESYSALGVRTYPIISTSLNSWLGECEEFLNGMRSDFIDPFFNEVAVPLARKEPQNCKAKDWALACARYDQRRKLEH